MLFEADLTNLWMFQATDLVMKNNITKWLVSAKSKSSGLREVTRILEEGIDFVKTKQGDARVILVGGGSIIIGETLAGVSEIIRPDYLEVANAVGAAVSYVFAPNEQSLI